MKTLNCHVTVAVFSHWYSEWAEKCGESCLCWAHGFWETVDLCGSHSWETRETGKWIFEILGRMLSHSLSPRGSCWSTSAARNVYPPSSAPSQKSRHVRAPSPCLCPSASLGAPCYFWTFWNQWVVRVKSLYCLMFSLRWTEFSLKESKTALNSFYRLWCPGCPDQYKLLNPPTPRIQKAWITGKCVYFLDSDESVTSALNVFIIWKWLLGSCMWKAFGAIFIHMSHLNSLYFNTPWKAAGWGMVLTRYLTGYVVGRRWCSTFQCPHLVWFFSFITKTCMQTHQTKMQQPSQLLPWWSAAAGIHWLLVLT